MLNRLQQAAALGLVRPIDYAFSRFLYRHGGSPGEVALAACLVSRQSGEGHVCVDLSSVAGTPLFKTEQQDGCPTIVAPTFEIWTSTLLASRAVGRPGAATPLILDEAGRLYLARYWQYESNLAASLRMRARDTVAGIQPERLRVSLDRYFPPTGEDEIDWQKIAAAVAALKRFTVISGGPGTGKTTTITRILALLLEQAGDAALRVALAAPTGKAAARLAQSIRNSKYGGGKALAPDSPVWERIPDEAVTLHRLLKLRPDEVRPLYHAGHPLALDLLVLDEASMVDLPLMARLVDALPPRARLILLGDKDQLFSVEAGKVLGDLCDAGVSHGYSEAFRGLLERATGFRLSIPRTSESHPLGDCIAILRKSHRFGSGSGIGALAGAVNGGRGDDALDILNARDHSDVSWQPTSDSGSAARLRACAVAGYRPYLTARTPRQALEDFECYRLLCAVRGGPFGVERLNRLVEDALREAGLIGMGERWYHGRPVMVTCNDYTLNLFNGDIGLILPDPEANGGLRAFFDRPQTGPGTHPDQQLKRILPSRLPTHETVYAMTVHKSQGSEFETLDLLLPDPTSPVVTRELVYTGITRARRQLRVWGRQENLRQAIATRVERASGLRQALWK